MKTRQKPKKKPSGSREYDLHLARKNRNFQESSASSRDIGPIPLIANIKRRESCRYDLKRFCRTYNPEAFRLKFSFDQDKEIERIQETVLGDALYAMADPRGDGKTTRLRMAVLWAISYGHRGYPIFIGANDDKATTSLDAIKTRIRFLPDYIADFPEISYPAIRLKGIAQKAGGQLCKGESTLIEWSKNRIILATVPPPDNWPRKWPLNINGMVPTSGAIMGATGLTADGIRGTVVTMQTGEERRPDYAFLDDPQTDESSASLTQNQTRLDLLSGAVMGMGGPEKNISAVIACTVIARNDFSDQILDRTKHPMWRGERRKMMRSMPKNMDAWQKYFDVYLECVLSEPPDFQRSDAYYKANRAVLDEGAEAGWEARHPGCVSAIQYAMHLWFRDRRKFMSEYQNSPELLQELGEGRQLGEIDLVAKLNTIPKGVVPRDCNRLTAFVDIQAEILFYAVCAWTESFGGALIDFGTFPRQDAEVFTAEGVPNKLSHKFPGLEQRALIYKGLAELVPAIIGQRYLQADTKSALTVSKCLIDAGFETEAVHDFLGRSPFAALLNASKGMGIQPARKPMNEYRKEPRDIVGWNWRIDGQPGGKGRFVSFDTHPWKSFMADAILAPAGASGSFYLPNHGTVGAPRLHPLLQQHLLSEYRTPTYGLGRRVEVWQMRPGERENHEWDCLIGCAVAAGVLGVKFSAAMAAGEKAIVVEAQKVDQQAEYRKQREAFEARRGF